MAEELGKLHATIHETEDGMVIPGGQTLTGGTTNSHNDHRIAMSMAVAGLLATGETVVTGSDCAAVSFPGFFELLARL